MNDLLDEKLERKISINSLFANSVFKEFIEEVTALKEGVEATIGTLEKQAVTADSLAQLNFELGTKSGYNAILSVVEAYKEEMEL